MNFVSFMKAQGCGYIKCFRFTMPNEDAEQNIGKNNEKIERKKSLQRNSLRVFVFFLLLFRGRSFR